MLKARIKLVVLQLQFPSPFHDQLRHLIKNIFLHALCYSFALISEGMKEQAQLFYIFSLFPLAKVCGTQCLIYTVSGAGYSKRIHHY